MPKMLIINNAEPGVDEFVNPLVKIVDGFGATSSVTEYKDCQHADKDGFDGIVMSGSPQGDDIVLHHLPYFLWLKNIDKPVLGICAGHHITGFLYGAELLRGKEPESGNFSVNTVKKDKILESMPYFFKVRQMHNDSVTLPSSFELLVTSETCTNQLMKHKHQGQRI